MKSDEEISTADSAQIESLIERVKQGKLEQDDAQLIERLLRTFLALITLLQRKNTTIKRLKQLFLGPQEKKGKGQSDASTGTTTTDAISADGSASSGACARNETSRPLICRYPRFRQPGSGGAKSAAWQTLSGQCARFQLRLRN